MVLSHAYEVSTTVYVTKSLGTPHGSTWISSYYPSINFSNDDWLWVSDDANDVARVLIGVSISGLMPSNSVINSAYLYAYNTDGDGGKNVYAYRIT